MPSDVACRRWRGSRFRAYRCRAYPCPVSRSRALAASTILLGAAFAGVAFGAAGGTELRRTSAVELVLILLGAVGVAAVLLWGTGGRLHGEAALAGLAALTILTALSITW